MVDPITNRQRPQTHVTFDRLLNRIESQQKFDICLADEVTSQDDVESILCPRFQIFDTASEESYRVFAVKLNRVFNCYGVKPAVNGVIAVIGYGFKFRGRNWS